ncbi:hypothetical protein [Paraburkholderia sediminicola]|uniref:hypothetical protein n=1 Tax=Paraburkholderia sediminicola TaxID=458836 RepID=UPI0038BDAA52
MKTIACVVVLLMCIAPVFGQHQIFTMPGQSTRSEPRQPTAKGISPVDDGAIVCPSLDEANWLFREIGRARVARSYMPEQARQLTKLKDGYDPWAEPKPSDYQCRLVPTGTPVNVKWQGGIPVVSGKMSDGRPFSGVTLPNMIDR